MAVAAHFFRPHPGVAHSAGTEAPVLDVSRGVDPLLHRRRRLRFRPFPQVLKMDGGDLHHNVNSVQKRPGNAAAVVVHIPLGAAAAPGGVAVPAAFAGVHGAYQHKFRRVRHRPGNPGDGDLSVLQWLAHQVKRILPEFRHLVQKQHALMGEGDFTRPWVGAAASESGIGHRVMGRTERPLGHKGIPGRQHSHDGIHLTDLQRFLPRHIRENGGQTLAEHTFA